MSDDLPPHPNIISEPSLCLYMYYEMDVDDDNYLYHKFIDNTCMLSIGCKPMMLSTLIWLSARWNLSLTVEPRELVCVCVNPS
jgi:hypothetical protein